MSLINDVFDCLIIVILIINSCVYAWSCRTPKSSAALNYFTVYIIAIFIVQFSATILAIYEKNNLYLSHFYFIIQFIGLSLFFKALFIKTQKKIVNFLLILILGLLGIQYYTTPDLFYQFNNLEIFITSVPLIVYSIIHLYNSLNKPPRYMYINAGILIYITTSTLIYILGNFLATQDNNIAVTNIWFLNKVLYIVYMLLIMLEWKMIFWSVKRK
ncbi:MAG: hypothetical protein ACJAR4_001122 [Psychroserpens sp.]|jgi:hypothetical protein